MFWRGGRPSPCALASDRGASLAARGGGPASGPRLVGRGLHDAAGPVRHPQVAPGEAAASTDPVRILLLGNRFLSGVNSKLQNTAADMGVLVSVTSAPPLIFDQAFVGTSG